MMSGYLILLLIIVVLLAVCAALLYRNKAQTEQHKRELQNTITQTLQTTVEHRNRLDDDLAVIEENHREETIIEHAHLSERRDFDNDWGGMPIELTGNNAADRGVTSASQAGITDNQV
jgi:hypothetical protein